MNTKITLSDGPKMSATIGQWLFFFFFLVPFANLTAQRIQLQMQIGTNASEARIQNTGTGYLSRETITFFDSLPVQLGLGVKIKAYRNFYVRLDCNYKAYRTFFDAEERIAVGGSRVVLGNLYNEKYSYSLLPEFQYTLLRGRRIEFPVYVFGGPVFSVEKGKNYSENYLFDVSSVTILGAIKPDIQTGWSIGLGCNPKWKRLGLMLEGRLLRIGYQKEGIIPGKIAYQHFTLMTGITYDLF